MFKSVHAAEIAIGTTVASSSGIATMWDGIFPIIAQIGIVAGCFYALHGCYQIIKAWYNGRKHRHHNNGPHI